MKHTASESISEVIDRIKREQQLSQKLQERQAMRLWAEVVGDHIASLAQPRDVKAGKLCLHVESAALRQELMINRPRILAEINSRLGEIIVSDIRFV
jgi:predicted nucleic acid-binding Zn ribbon protein